MGKTFIAAVIVGVVVLIASVAAYPVDIQPSKYGDLIEEVGAEYEQERTASTILIGVVIAGGGIVVYLILRQQSTEEIKTEIKKELAKYLAKEKEEA